jgi:hypothetical protein
LEVQCRTIIHGFKDGNGGLNMGNICEHEFEMPSSKDPDYSLIEYDLYAKLGLTIRKNLKTGYYEIVTIKKPREVKYRSKYIYDIARKANELEGAENTTVECGSFNCPKRR